MLPIHMSLATFLLYKCQQVEFNLFLNQIVMKSRLYHAAIVMLVFVTSCSSLKTTPESIQEITRKVESKDYTVVVNYANPMRWKQIYLNSEYDLRIKNDSAFAYLPYFGVAYSAPYGGGEGGIKFAEPLNGYAIKPNKKSDGWDIRFKVKGLDDGFEISMNIFNTGSSMITVNSFNRDPITFTGEVEKEDK